MASPNGGNRSVDADQQRPHEDASSSPSLASPSASQDSQRGPGRPDPTDTGSRDAASSSSDTERNDGPRRRDEDHDERQPAAGRGTTSPASAFFRRTHTAPDLVAGIPARSAAGAVATPDPSSPVQRVRFSHELVRPAREERGSPPGLDMDVEDDDDERSGRPGNQLYTIHSATGHESQQHGNAAAVGSSEAAAAADSSSRRRSHDVADEWIPERRRLSRLSALSVPRPSASRRHLCDDSSSAANSMHDDGGRPTADELGLGGKGHVSFTPSRHDGDSLFKLPHYREWIARQRRKAANPRARCKARLAALYKRYIIEGLLRQKPLPPSKDGRHIPLLGGGGVGHDGGKGWKDGRPMLIDERSGKPYISNFIRSSRYTVWDFLPKQLFFQFSRLANFYFLIIGILQMIPGLSTTGTYTTIGPLIVFVGLSMAKEGYDDYRRYRLDKVENRSETYVLDFRQTMDSEDTKRKGLRERFPLGEKRREKSGLDGESGVVTELREVGSDGSAVSLPADPWRKVQWQDVRVGDVIRLRRDDNVPADLVLLSATNQHNIAYIETMALDGETNLKSKQACPLLASHCGSIEDMRRCAAEVVSEDPNIDLYNFEGRATVDGVTVPLTLNQVVYRGSTLRNTAEAIGLVINTGEECKIRMNANRNVRAKAPYMQFVVNRIVVLLVIFVILLSVGCTIGNEMWKDSYLPSAWYLSRAKVPVKQIFIGFVIAFNTLIPLSLYVSLEIIKLGQLYLLHDVEMYDPVTDTPMVANTTTILENLGQVSYVFSDKTGTLTENLMKFRKMSVAGTAWLHDMDLKRAAAEREAREAVELKRRMAERGASGKGKAKAHKQDSSASAHSRHASRHLGRDGTSFNEDRTLPSRAASQMSHHPVSQWKSTVRPDQDQPELTTEDLIQYLRHKPNTTFSRKARHFILCIALCHTCLPEVKEDGRIEFQAASPDELALVQAAQDLGYMLVDRPAQSIVLRSYDADGAEVIETYEVLDVIEFSSRRKRMSIIVRMPDGRITLFCKGADSVILPRLKLNNLAIQKASVVERRASKRKSVEQERAMLRRMSESGPAPIVGGAGTPRTSLNLSRAGTVLNRRGRGSIRRSGSLHRVSIGASNLQDEVESWLTRRETEELGSRQDPQNSAAYQTPRTSFARRRSLELGTMAAASQGPSGRTENAGSSDLSAAVGTGADEDPYEGMVDEAVARNDGLIFERCFSHVDDFASEGLRTLLFAYRVLEEAEYASWAKLYREASSSLDDRQARIEQAADMIEQGFDLAGATAIEDKLQQGVPETIDKLRRANIKVWMLTGDKRETAINIAHSARICKPYSELYVLDAATPGGVRALHDMITATLVDVGRGMVPHSVVVVDGQTLAVVEEDEALRIMFFDLVTRVDSVICCRASPSQKATLVRCIRDRVPSSLTLAIGDGANDIAMIQASHVGIGISGREGLQAARISDYSIAQFRFLQRLLFVHGRWNYIRTAKYILGTFWKEVVFYLVQALYQRYNGYTGTSLYEPASLTVFNTLFTSLPVILLGIFEQDLHADTLLAVPELYTYGQRNEGFTFKKFVAWMFMASTEAVMIYYFLYGFYNNALFTQDTTLFAMGNLAFTVCVVFINLKMLVIELHNQTIISYLGLFISISGWFVWNIFLAVVYKAIPGPYIVRHSFLKNFGRNYMWWTTGILALVAVIVLEIGVAAIRRIVAPTDQDIMQVVEHYDGVMKVMHEHAAGEGGGGGGGGGGSSGAMVASGAMEEGESMPGGVVGKIAVAAAESYEPATTTINGPRHSASLIRKAGRKSLDDCLSPGVPSVAVRTSSDVPPTPARASFDMPPTPTRRPSRHLDRDDHYVPRPFTPPVEEEREDVDPRIGAVVVGGVGGRWAATSSVPGKGLGSRRKAPVPPPVVSSSESASVYGPSDHVLDASAFTASPAELSLRTSGIPLSPASRRPEAGGT